MRARFKTPSDSIFDGEADSVSLPTPNGQIMILNNHESLIGVISPGEIIIRSGSKENRYLTGRGIYKIRDNTVRLLSESANIPASMTDKEVDQAKKNAQELKTKNADDRTNAYATAQLEKLLHFEKIKRRHSRHHTIID